MICKKCLAEKGDGDFYRHPKSKTGFDSTCKECRKLLVRENRAKRIDYYREYDKQRANDPKRVKAREDYAKTDQGKASGSRAKKRYIERNAIKRAVHIITGNAIRDRRIAKQPCEVCGEPDVHAHHDDYSKPLDVRWLCPFHHKQWHNENGEGANAN